MISVGLDGRPWQKPQRWRFFSATVEARAVKLCVVITLEYIYRCQIGCWSLRYFFLFLNLFVPCFWIIGRLFDPWDISFFSSICFLLLDNRWCVCVSDAVPVFVRVSQEQRSGRQTSGAVGFCVRSKPPRKWWGNCASCCFQGMFYVGPISW